MTARKFRASLVALTVLAASPSARAQNPGTYQVGTIPVAGALAGLEFPVHRDFAVELDVTTLGQGTYQDQNPFAYLAFISPTVWGHYDGVQNLRLSLAFAEFFYREVPPLGIPESHEERGVARARFQQPHGNSALYEILQLDVRSFVDPTGTRRLVYRPRFRIGQGFNLDAARIHSLVLYEEVAFHGGGDGYYARPFEFFRSVAGYTWTTRRGTFVTLALAGQIGLNPAATRFDVLWGPVISFYYRWRAPPPEAPTTPPEVDLD